MSNILEISGLSVHFNTSRSEILAVDNVDIIVPIGRTTCIVGESGSGKSTVVHAVMRLLGKEAEITGRVTYAGENLLSLPEKAMRMLRGKEISMIFQNPGSFLNPTKTIGQQIIEPLLYHHLHGAAAARRIGTELLREVGISDADLRFDNYPFEFSGGMLQRAIIAMALIAEPTILIADEPTTALDVTIQAEVLRLIKRLQAERHMTVIFITHDLAVAAQMADDIYVMRRGKVVDHVTATDILNTENHVYLQGLLRAIPRMDGPRVPLPVVEMERVE